DPATPVVAPLPAREGAPAPFPPAAPPRSQRARPGRAWYLTPGGMATPMRNRDPTLASSPNATAGPSSRVFDDVHDRWMAPRTLHDTDFERLEHGPGAVAHAELGQDVRYVILDRAFGDAERVR